MSSRFYFGGSDSGSDVDEDAPLPFPKPIDRAAFLAPDFDPTTFLSGLSHRFQTLEDLQTELRELSQTLNKELVDLVNDNYQEFLSLGSTLSGGEERIEDIRVGLLGFQREIQTIRDKVDARRNEITELLDEKKARMHEVGIGRALLDIAERLDQLEEDLNLTNRKARDLPNGKPQEEASHWGSEWTEMVVNESDDEYDSDEDIGLPPRLRRRTEEFLILKHLPRLRRISDTLLSDLDMAIKQESEVKIKQQMLQIRAAVEE